MWPSLARVKKIVNEEMQVARGSHINSSHGNTRAYSVSRGCGTLAIGRQLLEHSLVRGT